MHRSDEPTAAGPQEGEDVGENDPGWDLYSADLALVEGVQRHSAPEHRLPEIGRAAGSERTEQWAQAIDGHPPVLRSHAPSGDRVDQVDYHPAWHWLVRSAVRDGLAAAPWRGESKAAHTERAAAMILWSQTETTHLDPLMATYATAPALAADPAIQHEWLPRLASASYDRRQLPASQKKGCLAGLAVTERVGGTDLRAIATVARPVTSERHGGSDDALGYQLTGLKWFVSTPMSDAFLALAQAPGGLTCFLVPRVLPDGRANTWRIRRLKRTVGAGAIAEVELDATFGRRLGDEGRGLRTLIPTTQALRIDTVLSGVGSMRAALVRAISHAHSRRLTAGSVIDKPLMQNVLADLAVETESATVLALRLAAALDDDEHDLLRVAVPLARFWIGKRLPAMVSEALECLGGDGYVEENGMGRIYRSLPARGLWEGTGNVAALDVLRAMSMQPRAMEVLLAEIDHGRGHDARLDRYMDDVAASLQAAARDARRDAAAVEAGARWIVERLAVALQGSLVTRHAPPAVSSAYLASRVNGSAGSVYGSLPLGRRTIVSIIDRALPR